MRKMLSKTTSSGETAFPWKLHMVLEKSTHDGFDDVISWVGNNAFKVHDPIQFEKSIMQQFFNQTQYKSFQRQPGKATGSYTHPFFIRGDPDACSFMIRVKVKKKGIRKNLDRNSRSKGSVLRIKGDSIVGKSYDNLVQPIRSTSSTQYESVIEPTPIRSVSPSSTTNKIGIFEPIPFDALGSSNNSSTTRPQTIISNINVVSRDNGCYIDRKSIYTSPQHEWIRPTNFLVANNNNERGGMIPSSVQQQPEQHYFCEKLRNTHYSNVDLDLDTIFDEDDSIIRYNSTRAKNFFHGDYNSPSNSYAVDDKGVFDHTFQMVENSLSILAKRTIDTY